MKTIFEKDDLVCRPIFCHIDKAGKDNGRIIGKFYGFKTDKENVYHHSAIVCHWKNGEIFARAFGDVDTTGGLECMNKSYEEKGIMKHPNWDLCDEQVMTMSDLEDYKLATNNNPDYKDIL